MKSHATHVSLVKDQRRDPKDTLKTTVVGGKGNRKKGISAVGAAEVNLFGAAFFLGFGFLFPA